MERKENYLIAFLLLHRGDVKCDWTIFFIHTLQVVNIPKMFKQFKAVVPTDTTSMNASHDSAPAPESLRSFYIGHIVDIVSHKLVVQPIRCFNF